MSNVLDFTKSTPKKLLEKIIQEGLDTELSQLVLIGRKPDGELQMYTTTTDPMILCYMSYLFNEFTRQNLMYDEA